MKENPFLPAHSAHSAHSHSPSLPANTLAAAANLPPPLAQFLPFGGGGHADPSSQAAPSRGEEQKLKDLVSYIYQCVSKQQQANEVGESQF